MIFLIDNGHGQEATGNCSPNGVLLEYKYARDIAKLLSAALSDRGFSTSLVTPELWDVSLGSRCSRVNTFCRQNRDEEIALISLHVDAEPLQRGQWGSASGLTSFVYDRASRNSRRLAQMITDAAAKRRLLGNRSVPISKYREGNFAILRDTVCPAVLVELGFMTNKSDVNMMMSRMGQELLVSAIADACQSYVNSIQS